MLLKRGDNNESVKQLQTKLGLEAIGNYGPKTEDAVKAFQLKNGLTPDGIVGNTTWNKIMGTETSQPISAAVVVEVTKPTATPVISVGGLKLDTLYRLSFPEDNGDKETKINDIQIAFNEIRDENIIEKNKELTAQGKIPITIAGEGHVDLVSDMMNKKSKLSEFSLRHILKSIK